MKNKSKILLAIILPILIVCGAAFAYEAYDGIQVIEGGIFRNSVRPMTDSSYMMGENTYRWSAGYFDDLYAETLTISGTGAGTTTLGTTTITRLTVSERMTVGGTTSLATTTISGDFIVNTDDFYINATSSRIGFGTSSPTTFFSVATSSNTALFNITDEGYIGIGTVAPDELLEIEGAATAKVHIDGAASARLEVDRGSTGNSASIEFQTANVGKLNIGMDGDGTDNFHIGDTALFAKKWLTIDVSSGNVGIATSSPTTTLEVWGIQGAHPFNVATSTGASLFFIREDGYVGIGTTSPTTTLDIAGSLKVSGSITFNREKYTWPTGQSANEILQTDGSGTLDWVATSTLAIYFSGLEGVPSDVITAGDDITWTGNTLNVTDSWYNAISDITLEENALIIGDASDLAATTTTSTLAIYYSGLEGVPSDVVTAGTAIDWTLNTLNFVSSSASIYFTGLEGVPSDIISAGTNLTWSANTLNVTDSWWDAFGDITLKENAIIIGNSSDVAATSSTSSLAIYFSGLEGVPSNVITAGTALNWSANTLNFSSSSANIYYSGLEGSPSNVITAGDHIAWTGDTLNVVTSTMIYFSGLEGVPSNVITAGTDISWTDNTLNVAVTTSTLGIYFTGLEGTPADIITAGNHIDFAADRTTLNVSTSSMNFAFSDLSGEPSDVITVGTAMAWSGNTLDFSSSSANIYFSGLEGVPSNVITAGNNLTWVGNTLNAAAAGVGEGDQFTEDWYWNNTELYASSTATKFGFGTSSPTTMFAVATSSNTALFSITDEGYVGIGTSTPATLLDVEGDLTVEGTFTIGSLAYTFPTSQTANYFFQTDGAGNLSWVSTSTMGIYYSGLEGSPSDTITAGTALSWSTDTLNFSSSSANIYYSGLEGSPSDVTTAGDHLTWSGNTLNVDSELEKGMITYNITEATTTGHTKRQHKFASAVTIVRVSCTGDYGSTTIQLDERTEAAPFTAGVDVLTASLVCDNSGTASTTAFDNAGIAANAPLSPDIEAMTKATSTVFIYVEFTIND